MAKFAPPESFDFSKPETWPEWKQRFLRFRLATKLNKEEEEVQVAALLYGMGKKQKRCSNSLFFIYFFHVFIAN